MLMQTFSLNIGSMNAENTNRLSLLTVLSCQ